MQGGQPATFHEFRLQSSKDSADQPELSIEIGISISWDLAACPLNGDDYVGFKSTDPNVVSSYIYNAHHESELNLPKRIQSRNITSMYYSFETEQKVMPANNVEILVFGLSKDKQTVSFQEGFDRWTTDCQAKKASQ